MARVWNSPSLPVIPWTRSRVSLLIRTLKEPSVGLQIADRRLPEPKGALALRERLDGRW
jgi:hypothetical protein